MGHKKRNIAPRSKQSPTGGGGGATNGLVSADGEAEPCATTDNPNSHSKIDPSDVESGAVSSPYSAIKLDCERALTALRRGNHTKALRLMKESCSRHESSALIHRVQGTVCVKVAAIIDDQNAKQRHLRNAIDSSRRAVELSPNSIEFAHFYANLLYEAANDSKEYEEVVQECERALGIENPVDPGKESLQEESQQKLPTAEARIGHVQNELRQLIQKSNIASLSTWMKNFGSGDEKIRFIPISRVAEDPMEVRLVQAKRPNEIKKATKTPEERRKEIEVRVAAARLLQQKSEVPQLQNEGDRAVDSSSVSGQRTGERKRNGSMRKNGSSAERKDLVKSYWDSMSMDQRKELLRVTICDLKAHFASSKDGLENEVLSEAISYAEVKKSWKFWVCCKCNDKFSASESHINHVVQEHITSLLPKMQSILPQSIDSEWADMLLNFSWKPLDVSAAVKMLENQSNRQNSDIVEDVYSGNHAEDCDDGFKDAWGSSPEKGNNGDQVGCNGYSLGINCNGNSTNIECRKCDGNKGPLACSLSNSWPISDDSECAKLLEKIHAAFQLLIKHKLLAMSHLNKVIQYTLDELQGLVSGSQLMNNGVDQTPICICFLGPSQLKKILKFLQGLSQSCGIGRYPDKSSSIVDESSNIKDLEIKEKIVLNGDGSYLLLDDGLLSSAIAPCTHHDFPKEYTIATTSGIYGNENGNLLDANALLSWIFAGPRSVEQLSSWMRKKEEKTQQGMEILQTMEKEFFQLQSLCERKSEHLSYEEAVQALENLCLEEGKKRETVTEFAYQSYEFVLKKRREELIESENDAEFISSRFELDAISNILKEAEALNVNQFGYEETYAGMNSQLYDLESGEDNWRSKGYLHQGDTCIEVAIQRQKEQLAVELSKIDARIMWNVTVMQNLELKLEPIAAYDYRSILLPLVKSYLRAHLEDLAERDATEKSDAAREAFLAELDLDTKKGSKGGSDSSRHSQEKTKEKKKIKEYRKSKDLKGTGCNEQHMLRHETDELVSSCTVVSDGGHPESENVFPMNANDLKQQEEDLIRKRELEEEERKLEETLEYQRHIENEAKQKLLAEQHKKSTQSFLEGEDEGLHDICLEAGVPDQHLNNHKQPCMQTNGLSNTFERVTVNTARTLMPIETSMAPSTQMIKSIHGANIRQDFSNGVVPVDDRLASDRRIGRKGRQQKSSTKLLDGSYQGMSSGKENVEVGRLQIEGCLKDQAKSRDPLQNGSVSPAANGTKTLRQLHVEEDDEERFQADLKQAVRQSIDTYEARQKFPLFSSSTVPHKKSTHADDRGVSLNEVTFENVSRDDVFGTGLRNEIGEYNCFLNVIIQSLWHLRRFRYEFLRRSRSEHIHIGEPCVVCALYDIFTALSLASTDTRREAVAPTSLRIALSNLYPDSNFFQEAQMNDASEVLAVLFDCLHKSFTLCSSVSDTESLKSNCLGSWDCANSSCIAHSLFGMDIFERMNCYDCGLESRHLKYTSFFHNINASALRMMKVMCAESSFDELLNFVEMNHQLACDPEAGGCGMLNYIHHILSAPPHVFTTVLGWQNTCESLEDIVATLSALNTEIDISVLYRGLDPKSTYNLVSVVCYYGQHYHCFAYSHDHEQWVMYDDKTVKVVGGWADVLTLCERGHLQPQVLFFEAVN